MPETLQHYEQELLSTRISDRVSLFVNLRTGAYETAKIVTSWPADAVVTCREAVIDGNAPAMRGVCADCEGPDGERAVVDARTERRRSATERFLQDDEISAAFQ
jgi:hypothetical protein